MQLQSRKVVGFPLLLLSVFSLSQNVSRGQVDSQKPSGASRDQSSLTHALCGFQGTEVLVLRVPGAPSGTSVKCGEELSIIYDEVGFYKVQIRNAAQGYISKAFVATADQQTPVHDENYEVVARVGMNGVAPPICAYCPDPKYTAEARSAKYQGNIILEAVIRTEGKAAYVRAIKVTTVDKQVVGTQTLDRAWVSLEEAAIDSVKQWRFKPAHDTDGKPVAVLVPIEITFRFIN
jgi:Gram-negative bacterial TonB protein C-terminal